VGWFCALDRLPEPEINLAKKDLLGKAIASERTQCFVSVASCWEMAIRKSLGKLENPEPIDRWAG